MNRAKNDSRATRGDAVYGTAENALVLPTRSDIYRRIRVAAPGPDRKKTLSSTSAGDLQGLVVRLSQPSRIRNCSLVGCATGVTR